MTNYAVVDGGEATLYPLRSSLYHYDDPFEPATRLEDWEVLK